MTPPRDPAEPAPGRAPPAAVVWERLELQGFGLHRAIAVAFSGGLETWIGPNETGKSTAVMGLLATLWGLAHLQDPHALGWARFRAWTGGPHRGAVTLRGRDGRRYTVTREFDRHQVRVVAHGDDGDEIVVDAVHNPNARKETSPYEPWLAATLGMTEIGLVLETFVVAQGDGGADPHRLQHEVQALVSGAGGGTYRAALERLAEALRARTRSLRPLGLGLADARNDRELEELEAEIAALRRSLDVGSLAADGLRSARAALARSEADHARSRAERERLQETVRAQASWVDRRDGARREARRLADVERALERARELQHAEREADGELRDTWPAFADAPDDAEAQLEAFTVGRRRLAEAEARLAEAEDGRAERRREALAAVERIGPPAADAEEPASGRSWGAIGSPAGEAVRRMRRAATSLVRQVRSVLAARERLAEAEAELSPIDAFGDLDEETTELLESYATRGRELAEALVRARTRRDELLERMRRHRAAFAEVRALDDEQLDALRSFDAAWERRPDPRPWRVAAALAGAFVGWFGVPWVVAAAGVTPPGWAAWLGAAMVAAGAAVVVPRRDATAAARSALAALGIEGDDESLRQRLRQREAYEAQRDQVEDDAGAYERAQAEAAAAEAAGVTFRDAVAPFLEALPVDVDPGEAYARWKLLAPRVEKERAAFEAQVGYLADAAIADLDGATATSAGESVIELARLAAFQGVVDAQLDEAGEAVTILELVSWLERVSEATWDLWQRSADEHDRQREARTGAEREREAARTLWAERVADAEAAVARAHADLDGARRDDAAATAALAWLWPRLATHAGADAGSSGEGSDGLIGDDEIPDAAIRGLDDDARVEPASPWDPQMLRQGWSERRRARDELLAVRRELRTHLDASGTATVDALERTRDHARLAAGGALTLWQELVRTHPDLPSAELDATDGVEEAFGHTAAAAAAARSAEGEAHEAVLEAQRALARSEGAEVVNIAATAEAIDAAEDAADRVREEIAELALAYRELAAAVEDFAQEHRQRLEHRASEYLARFASEPDRRVVLGEDFAATVRERGGDVAVPAQLSQGARDQLALSLRLAIADLVSDDVALPLVFDDPFLHWDDDRLERARDALTTLAQTRQVLVLSHRPSIGSWGKPVTRSTDAARGVSPR